MHLIFVKLKKSRVFRYLEDVFRKNIEAEIKTFNEKNIELSKREEEYKLKYGKLNSKFVFEFEGKKLTLSEIVSKFRSKNRDVRERAFKTMYRGIYQKREEIHHILENLIKIRTQKAINSGFENYRDFRWIELLKFYYTPDDTERYREGVIKEVVPLYEELLEELKTRLKIRNLRPWDVNASMFKKGEFKFFKNHREFLKLGLETANLIDPYFAEVLDVMNKNDRLDLMARKNKQQGGYMTYTQDIRLPFIFMNASGTLEDFMTLMHELGHAVNYMLSRDIENPFLRTPVSEFAEVASIGMEFFALEELKNKLSEDVYIDFMARYILNILKKFIHIGKIDGFQHFIYLYPDLKPEDRDDYFVELDKKLSPSNVKWDRFEKWRNVTWYKQIHIFEYPFYYIDYGIAQIGALNLWKFYRENKSRAIEFYKKGFSSGGTKSLPELYKSTGIEFRFDRRAIANVVKHLKGVCKEIKILKN
jgi:oligoendopeptidase F